MTICFFSAQYLPTPGGVERYTWNLARRFTAAGHRALVVTAALPGLPARETDEYGIEIYRLPSFPVMGGRFPVLK
ncbi:glycosyltransferase, partial [Gemmiger sp.]